MITLIENLARAVGYDKTHITRTAAYREVDAFLDRLGLDRLRTCALDALDISAGYKWRARGWGKAAMRANMHRWGRTGWRRLPNAPHFPVTIRAIAENN